MYFPQEKRYALRSISRAYIQKIFKLRPVVLFDAIYNAETYARRLDLIVIENERRVVSRGQKKAGVVARENERNDLLCPRGSMPLTREERERERERARAHGTKWKNNLQKWNSVGGGR